MLHTSQDSSSVHIENYDDNGNYKEIRMMSKIYFYLFKVIACNFMINYWFVFVYSFKDHLIN